MSEATRFDRIPKTILLATDLSCRCDRPLDRAVQLARRWDAQLIVLHVADKTAPTVDEAAVKERLWADMPARDVRFRFIVDKGPVAETVLRQAAALKADLIVTGVARYNELGDFMLGTTVDRLVRQAPVPVLVVKRRASHDYQNVAVATDFSDCSARAVEAAAAIFPAVSIDLAHAYRVPFEGFIGKGGSQAEVSRAEAEEATAFLDRLQLPPEVRQRLRPVIEYGSPCDMMAALVRDRGTDLMVIGTHGRTGFRQAMIGSTAEALLFCLPCDVLMVRDRP